MGSIDGGRGGDGGCRNYPHLHLIPHSVMFSWSPKSYQQAETFVVIHNPANHLHLKYGHQSHMDVDIF